MSPGDHCPLAKKMFAPKPAPPTEAQKVEYREEYARQEGEGVWVTYYESFRDVTDQGEPHFVAFYRDEIEALRAAVASGNRAKFLRFGEEL